MNCTLANQNTQFYTQSFPFIYIFSFHSNIFPLFLVEMTSCGGQTSDNITYLVQSSSTSISSPCMYKVCPLNTNICRIRYDFTVGSFFYVNPKAGPYVYVSDVIACPEALAC